MDNLKSSTDFIDLDTYYQMICMIKDSFFVEHKKIKMLRENHITAFFYFILVYLSKNTTDKEVFDQKMVMLYREVCAPGKKELKKYFYTINNLCFRDKCVENKKINDYVKCVLSIGSLN